ncbi:3-dehydroquinate synthase [Chlamydiales bacterium SCGC AG-110-P3]|nr:3-dehydroquinate synthase [Chlamydiales bacterium SCGC AG-110-P3]
MATENPTTSASNSVTIRTGALEYLEEHLAPMMSRCSHVCVISDNTVFSQYGERVTEQIKLLNLPQSKILIPQGEAAKTLEIAKLCWEQMEQAQLDRRSIVIALGGGTVCDIAGFAASCFMRGIDCIHIPTTLLAMCDAAIGGKTGVNLGSRKNLIGTFHQPKAIIIDPACLTSLPDRELRSGLAEVIKYGVINDADLLSSLENNMESLLARDPAALTSVIETAAHIKCAVVEQDFHDKGARVYLNFGHTFSHALEGLTDYKHYLHGEAVAIGMCCAAQLSKQLGFIDETVVERVEAICIKAGLPTKLPNVSDDALTEKMTQDKKTQRGTITCIVINGIGDVMKLDNIASQIVKEALHAKRKRDARAEATTSATL